MITDIFLTLAFALPKFFFWFTAWITSRFSYGEFNLTELPYGVSWLLSTMFKVLRYGDAFCPDATPCSERFGAFLVHMLILMTVIITVWMIYKGIAIARGVRLQS